MLTPPGVDRPTIRGHGRRVGTGTCWRSQPPLSARPPASQRVERCLRASTGLTAPRASSPGLHPASTRLRSALARLASPPPGFARPSRASPHRVWTGVSTPRPASPSLTMPRPTSPHLNAPHRGSPHRTSPRLAAPRLPAPPRASPYLAALRPACPARFGVTAPRPMLPRLARRYCASPGVTSPRPAIPRLVR